MKTFKTGLLEGRMTRWVVSAAVLIGIAASIGAMDHRRHRLSGSWIGKGDGTIWNDIQAPTDPTGRRTAVRVNFMSYSSNLAGLLIAFGADTFTEFVGECELFSNDTGKWTLVGYALAQGNPPQIRGINVGTGTWKFTGPDTAELHYNMKVYSAASDANADGFPDEGTQPILVLTNLTDTARRIPLPQ